MKERYIRDILLFHDFPESSGQLWSVIDVIKRLSDNYVGNPVSTCTVVWADGQTSPEKIRRALSKYAEHKFKGDLFLLLTRAVDPEADAVIIKTRSGYMLIGPNDGSLGCVPQDDLQELRVILEPSFDREFSRRLYAAAMIAKGRSLDEFSKIVEITSFKR